MDFLDKITMVDKNDIYEKTNLNKDKPIISIFPPIAWDLDWMFAYSRRS